ncbi:hypothetical protein N7478_007789 [Penicillium angulare]|uniref:uncharacterized protein n=1 Tax=Penicillium angulare TaxID=116970 RepID=UPI0025409DDD|nr:uncharacterized protein N7478_007789 [Penicillium angulare]KAJ5272664.1 hypothetical protein N7478_007789 [Penicillium angulare]
MGDSTLYGIHDPTFETTTPWLIYEQAQCAIGTRKGLVLSEPEWLTDPWTHHPKTRKDMLVDILLEIPSLYENVDNMNLLPDGKIKSSHRHNIQKMNYVIMTRLENWNTRYAATLPTTYSGPHWQTLSSVETNSIADAHVMAIYWASSIHAYHIYRTVSDGECDFIGLDPDDCCRSIIRCVPLFLHPSTGIFRQHLIPFPLMTADRHLNSVQSTKLQAERDYLQALRESPKFAAMHQFISSMQSQIVTF